MYIPILTKKIRFSKKVSQKRFLPKTIINLDCLKNPAPILNNWHAQPWSFILKVGEALGINSSGINVSISNLHPVDVETNVLVGFIDFRNL